MLFEQSATTSSLHGRQELARWQRSAANQRMLASNDHVNIGATDVDGEDEDEDEDEDNGENEDNDENEEEEEEEDDDVEDEDEDGDDGESEEDAEEDDDEEDDERRMMTNDDVLPIHDPQIPPNHEAVLSPHRFTKLSDRDDPIPLMGTSAQYTPLLHQPEVHPSMTDTSAISDPSPKLQKARKIWGDVQMQKWKVRHLGAPL
jgi:hypothetical protein